MLGIFSMHSKHVHPVAGPPRHIPLPSVAGAIVDRNQQVQQPILSDEASPFRRQAISLPHIAKKSPRYEDRRPFWMPVWQTP
jgi:hypothetical protein